MIARRAEDITPFLVMEVLERAQVLEAQGRKVIHMEVGEPDFDTPACVQEAMLRAVKDGQTHYTHSLGILPLREAIAEHYGVRYGVRVSPDQILVTAGTSPAMWMLFSALLEAGDHVILTDPHYACYPNLVRFSGGETVCVDVLEEDGFQFRPGDVRGKLSARTKAILINSPANPTGTLLSAERMAALANLGPLVISDEIYHGLVYEGREHSILEFTDRAIAINGFSKAFAMTGWRLGYVIVPPALVRPLQKIHQNFFISANAFVQAGGIAALREGGPDNLRMRGIYDQRRRFLVPALRRLGFGVAAEPTGAFYVLANAKRFSDDSYAFAFEILERAGVCVAPGVGFGTNGEGYLRFSYANSLENLTEGLRRLEAFLAAR
ncbi:MAG TPA: pyridoxal phosphate-dependent aminotransferase [Candidatus Sulfotelmatobacter sp.]|nr:pyridoxal phosphate-dependent aminotransferase [Candidatus Sulfotelmatobacter sp.]